LSKRKAEADLEEAKRFKQQKEEWRRMFGCYKNTMSRSQIERLEEWKPLAAWGVKRPWHLLVTELAQKNALIHGTHKVMMMSTTNVKENAALTKSLEKLYEDVEQFEIKLEKARKEEEDKPATSSSKC